MTDPVFPLRSGRDYLHSSTVLNHILDGAGYEPANIDFEFAKRTVNNRRFLTERPEDPELLVGVYQDNTQTLYIVDAGTPITETEEYDDKPVLAASRVEDKSIVIPVDLEGYSGIEKIIAAYKYLLLSLPGNEGEKFALARLKLKRLPEKDITISFRRQVSGSFYQASILDGDDNIGFMLFGEWR